MDDNLKIKVTIGDRVYPLTIRNEGEEEGIRAAVKKINELLKSFEKNYEVRDKQDVLAMCALQIASKNEVKNVYDDLDTKNVKNKLINMEQLIDSYL